MAKRKARSGSFYYASGKRIPLSADEEVVAIDVERYRKANPDKNLLKLIEQQGRVVGSGLVLVQRDQLTGAMWNDLQSPGLTQPVFERDGTLMIALPEIRVEDCSTAKLKEIAQFASSTAQPIQENLSGGRISIVPRSNDGWDSLNLANQIVQQFNPVSVSPRFVRVTPHPRIVHPEG